MKKLIRIFSILLILIIGTVLFSACSNNNVENNSDDNTLNSSNNNADNKDTSLVVALTLKNYQDYFTLQEEVVSYSENRYIKNPGNFSCVKATQTTKFSILLLKSNIEFENVSLTIANDTGVGYDVSGNRHHDWTGNGGILKISYDGQGVLSLYASYDGYDGYAFKPMQYAVSEISGNVKIKGGAK